MRMPWTQAKSPTAASAPPGQADFFDVKTSGEPLLVSVALLDEDPDNPRTEVPDADLDELAEDIRQQGILQPIVVHPVDTTGRYRVHFGAKRLRAAERAGLREVPVVVRAAPADPYAQVAENQKRHGLSPLDLARFIKTRSQAGDSNATIAKRLGMNLTTVAHHLALLELPPELDQAMKAGRCTSPRTLHELRKLHREVPERVRALVAGDAEITRTTVTAMRAAPTGAAASTSSATLLAQANAACAQLEQAIARLNKAEHEGREEDLAALRRRIADLASRLA
jgi:ParB family chromosome partitioning protein